MEVILSFIKSKKFINRGFLIGPYCPIYGCGALLITFLLRKYSDDIVALFCLGMILSALLEYYTSFLLEKIFKARWWDYSTRKYNINGRICLNTMIPFGILGVIMMKIIHPALLTFIYGISNNLLTIISIVLFILFLIDNVLSISILISVRKENQRFNKDNTEEMNRKVYNRLRKMGWRYQRLLTAFPNVKYKVTAFSKRVDDTMKRKKER